MTWKDIPGWFDYSALYDEMVEAAPKDRQSTFVEIGCWLGRSTAYLAQKIKESGKPIILYAVDHGFGSPGGEDYHLHEPVLKEFGGNVAGKLVSNLKECGVLDRVVPIIRDSLTASTIFSSRFFDFVFIDGAHDPQSVRDDIGVWWSLVRLGGVLAGHDYNGCWLGVCEAVDRFFQVPRPAAGEPITTFALRDPSSESCWSRRRKEAILGGLNHAPRR